MGSYAYLTAGIITARQAELMKNALANAKTGPALHDSPDARILCDRRHHCRAVCAFHYQQNTGIKTDRRNLYLGIPRNPSAGTVIYHVLGYL